MRRKNRSRVALIESLEPRTLLSVVIAAGGKSATYTDYDGDLVTVKVTAGTLDGSNFITVAGGLGEYLQTIDFSGGGFDNAGLTVTAAKSATGDGLAHVGFIDSTGHDLGAVSISGDLGRIIAGDNATPLLGLKSLKVRSMGLLGLDNQPGGATSPLTSTISGLLGSLSIKGDAVSVAIVADVLGPVTIGGSFVGGTLTSIGNMAAVKITGNLEGTEDFHSGYINVGANLASLSVGGSILGSEGDSSGSVFSFGNIGPVTVKGSVIGKLGQNSGSIASTGSLGAVTIGGSLVGGSGQQTGRLNSGGTMGNVTIKHDVLGDAGSESGTIASAGTMGNISVGGSVAGGTGDNGGSVRSNTSMGTIKIAGDLRGGLSTQSGQLYAIGGNMKAVTIGGSVIGGGEAGTADEASGLIAASNNIASVTIGRDLRGGPVLYSGAIYAGIGITTVKVGGSVVGGAAQNTGYIRGIVLGTISIAADLVGGTISGNASVHSTGLINGGTIAAVTIGGSIFAGLDNSSGTLALSGAIVADFTIGTVAVKGSLVGSVGTGGNVTRVAIAAHGQVTQTAVDLAIKSVKVGGRVERANILAGYTADFAGAGALNPDNGDAQIGAVTVAGDWIASSIVAGAQNVASTHTNFGNGNDASIGAGTAGITSTIASITIGGLVLGTPVAVSNTDHFGFVAQKIGTVKIGGVAIALNPAPGNDNIALGFGTDFDIHEV